MVKTFFTLFLGGFISLTQVCHSQGAILDDGPQMLNTFYAKEQAGFAKRQIPEAYSLLEFAPSPQEQKGGTCVGWSLVYNALSIMHNRAMGVTGASQKEALAFAPYQFHTQFHQLDGVQDKCSSGIVVAKALQYLMQHGVARQGFTNTSDSCATIWDEYSKADTWAISRPFAISDAFFVKKKVSDLKIQIANGVPVIISMNWAGVENSESLKSESAIIEYSSRMGKSQWNGHAMCIIGYDDNIENGSFLVRNSWGENWGQDGNIYITYSDYKKSVHSAYCIDHQIEDYNKFNTDVYSMEIEKDPLSNKTYDRIDLEDDMYYEGLLVNGVPSLGYFMRGDKTWFGSWKKGKLNGPCLFLDDEVRGIVNFENDVPISILRTDSLSFMEMVAKIKRLESDDILQSYDDFTSIPSSYFATFDFNTWYLSQMTDEEQEQQKAVELVIKNLTDNMVEVQSRMGNFQINKFEVTIYQWEILMGENPSYYGKLMSEDEYWSSTLADCPISNISYEEIQDFISKINGFSDTQFRLPSIYEWHDAATYQQENDDVKYAGGNNGRKLANYSRRFNKLMRQGTPVGYFNSNQLGLYDMSGNVSEWCDGEVKDYTDFGIKESDNPENWRYIIGGCWNDSRKGCQINRSRSIGEFDFKSYETGFRLAAP